jgi:hypothetical protein
LANAAREGEIVTEERDEYGVVSRMDGYLAEVLGSRRCRAGNFPQ